MEIKEIKQKIRSLRKIKKDLKSGSKERLSIGREIKVLLAQLGEQSVPEPLKEPIIKEILYLEKQLKLIPTFKDIGIDLHRHSLKDLKIHLEKLKTLSKGKRGI
jgi:hypothetical protein